MVQFAYSTNEENYSGHFDTVEQALAESGFSSEVPTVWVGEVVQATAQDFLPDADDIIDHMVNASSDGAPECADDYLDGIPKEKLKAMSEELVPMLEGLFQKHGIDINPTWFTVKNVTKHEFQPEE